MFREVPMVEVREVLRLWLGGHGLRAIADLAQLDRKTVPRYLEAAERAGLKRSGGERQLTDELLGALAEELRAGRHGGRVAIVSGSSRAMGAAPSDAKRLAISAAGGDGGRATRTLRGRTHC